MPDEVPSELTPEQRIAKLESDLAQAQAAQADAGKVKARAAKLEKALWAIKKDYPEHYAYGEAVALNRTPVRPQESAPQTPETPPADPGDPIASLKGEILSALSQYQKLNDQKITAAMERIDGLQATHVSQSAQQMHPDLGEHSEELNAVLEKFPGLASSPEGMDIAATYVKREKIKAQAKQSALDELAKRDADAMAHDWPEPGHATAPEPALLLQDGENIHGALERLFPDRR